MMNERRARARRSLDGLSVGDAFGERFFQDPGVVKMLIAEKATPAPPWRWTDDTAMALSIVEVLEAHGSIVPGALAEAFARRYRVEPDRGYGAGAHRILAAIGRGVPYEIAAKAVFDGQGSMGNGGAMRSAPIGGFFADDIDAVIANAARSAEPTHAHPEGVAGAIAIAVGAALACTRAFDLRAIAAHTPEGKTRDGILRAADLPRDLSPADAASVLGNGSNVISSDTVPFCLYAASRFTDDFEEALWYTVAGLGDRDTTCAIVGGIVALSAEVPRALIESREPLGI